MEHAISVIKTTKSNKIHLGRLKLNGLMVSKLLPYLENNKTAKSITFLSNNLESFGCIVICNFLKLNDNFGSIGLSDNQIGYDGAVALRELFIVNNTIWQIYLPVSIINIIYYIHNNNIM